MVRQSFWIGMLGCGIMMGGSFFFDGATRIEMIKDYIPYFIGIGVFAFSFVIPRQNETQRGTE